VQVAADERALRQTIDVVPDMICYDMIYLTAIGLTPGDSSTVHIYTQKIHRTTQTSNT